MKKLLLLLLLFILIPNTSAKTYYTDYTPETNYQIEPIHIEKNDTKKIEIEYHYLTYIPKTKKEFSLERPGYKDVQKLDNYIIQESDWFDIEPYPLENRKIETRQIYEITKGKKIKHLHFYNMNNGKNELDITSIKIYLKEKEIPYQIYLDNIRQKEIETMLQNTNHNANFKTENDYLFELSEEGYLDDLKIKIEYIDNLPKTLTIKVTEGALETSRDYAISYIEEDEKQKEYTLDDFEITNLAYEEPFLSNTPETTNKVTKVEYKTQYKTIEKWYEYLITYQQFCEGYHTKDELGCQIDYDTKTPFYRIVTRDKIELKDDLRITDYQFDFNDFIIENTIEKIKWTSNINPLRNGIYNLNLITPNKTIPLKVKVDIRQNDINTLKKQNEYLKTLEIENRKLNIKINNSETNIKKVLIEKDELAKKYNDYLIKTQYEIKELKKSKQGLQEVKLKNNNKKKPLLLLIPLLFPIYFIIQKIQKRSIEKKN